MCGRFAITSPPEAMRAYFRYREKPNFPPRYNIAPTQPIPLVIARGGARHFLLARWGFLPGFVKDVKKFPLLINARAETLAEKPSFRAALRRRRCLIPADAWYEWRANVSGPKTPFLLRRAGGGLVPGDRLMAFAGLWETYLDPSGAEIDTACIVTTQANGATVAIHERMPAILAPEHFEEWLDPDETVAPPLRLLRPAENDEIEFFAISTGINRVSADSPDVQAPP